MLEKREYNNVDGSVVSASTMQSPAARYHGMFSSNALSQNSRRCGGNLSELAHVNRTISQICQYKSFIHFFELQTEALSIIA